VRLTHYSLFRDIGRESQSASRLLYFIKAELWFYLRSQAGAWERGQKCSKKNRALVGPVGKVVSVNVLLFLNNLRNETVGNFEGIYLVGAALYRLLEG